MPTTSPVTITLTNSNITTRTSSSDYTPTDSSAVVSVTWRHNGAAEEAGSRGAAPFNVVVEMYACSNIEQLVYKISFNGGSSSNQYEYAFGVTTDTSNTVLLKANYGHDTSKVNGQETSWTRLSGDSSAFYGWCGDGTCTDDPEGGEYAVGYLSDGWDIYDILSTTSGGCINGNPIGASGSADDANSAWFSRYLIVEIDSSNVTYYTPPTCSGNSSITNVTGKTCTVRVPSWTNGTETATATISCTNHDDVTPESLSSGGTVTFRDLENGTTYRFRVVISDGTTSLTITTSSGENPYATTYKCTVTSIATSTCRIRCTLTPTAGGIQGATTYQSCTVSYVISGSISASGTSSAGGSTVTVNGFTHNTLHNIRAYVTGITYNGSPDTDVNVSDSSTTTKRLSLTGEVGERTMTSIETSWQALVDGSAQNADNLSGDYYTFCTSSTSSHNHYPTCTTTNSSGYIKSETTPTCTVPTYSSNKTIVFENLTYYCQYSMTVYITDGTNCVSYTLTAETIYPYARIYYNGAWYKAFVYVYDGGWNLSIGNVYDGSWRVFNGMST